MFFRVSRRAGRRRHRHSPHNLVLQRRSVATNTLRQTSYPRVNKIGRHHLLSLCSNSSFPSRYTLQQVVRLHPCQCLSSRADLRVVLPHRLSHSFSPPSLHSRSIPMQPLLLHLQHSHCFRPNRKAVLLRPLFRSFNLSYHSKFILQQLLHLPHL